MLYRLLFLSVLIFSVSCSQSYYVQPVSDQVASVSFSNLSDEMADLYIILNDMTYMIDGNVIEKKQPQYKSKFKTNVLAGNKVTFKYVYNWLIREKTEVTSTYTAFNAPSRVSSKNIKDVKTCSSEISFVPEKNKHYEVYFGVFTEKCVIKVSEVYEGGGKINKLIKIKTF